MTKAPLVSILTCVFNQRPYIEQTIRSVMNQTYQDWEWVILDDGSTDGTSDIIKKYKDSRIKYFFQENAGVNNRIKTFNKALNICKGDFIATLDGDDYWPEYKLEVQIKNFNDPDVVLSYGEAWLVNQKDRKIFYICLPSDKSVAYNNPMGSVLKELLEKHSCFIVNATVMCRKSALLNIGGFIGAEGTGQDYMTWVKLSLEGKFSAIPICLGYYRKHPTATTLKLNPEVRFDYDTNCLREFILSNQSRLHDLGISYDLDRLDKGWREIKAYLPYNHAIYMLMIGSFNEAKAEFKKFLLKMPSIKHQIIYSIILICGLIKIDLVNPLINFKSKLKDFVDPHR